MFCGPPRFLYQRLDFSGSTADEIKTKTVNWRLAAQHPGQEARRKKVECLT